MKVTPTPDNEAQRMYELCCLNLQFTPPEKRSDRVARLTSRGFDALNALGKLAADLGQWFKSAIGLAIAPTPQEVSFCSRAKLGEAPFVVDGLLRDPRFADVPPVTGEANDAFYAGHPICSAGGDRVGASATVSLRELLIHGKGKAMRFLVGIVACLFICGPSYAVGIADLSNKDAVSGLKDALTQGSGAAIGKLGVENGFLGNDKVKIPLPDAMRKIEKGLKLLGMQRQAEELIVAMNRAAEQAVPEAKELLVGAIKNMSVQDAKQILTGGDTAATDYFRKTTNESLTQKFLPIVTKATQSVGAAEKYNQLAGKGVQMGVLDAKQARIEDYVTQKALDGLFSMIAEQEKAIRSNPVGAATGMAQKVFGMLGK